MREVNVDGTVGPLTDLSTDPTEAMGQITSALRKPKVVYVKVMAKERLTKKRRPQRKKKRKTAKAQRRTNRKK